MQGRKRATVKAVESTFPVWLNPYLGDRTLDAITDKDVEDLMRSMAAAGVGSKSIRNYGWSRWLLSDEIRVSQARASH
jgi:hypothetical protein